MGTLQTICIFVTGYLVSRLVLRAEAHQVFVTWLLERAGGRTSQMVLGVMLAAFFLSTFIPNALTVLALIPVVTRLREALGEGEGAASAGTLLAMALVYGANIGGMGSLLGSPANIYLLVNLRVFVVPGAEALHFVSWLAFGLPMALLFLFCCWAVFGLLERRAMALRIPVCASAERGPRFALATRWALVWLFFWAALIGATMVGGLGHGVVAAGRLHGWEWAISAADAFGLLFSLGLIAALFLIPQRVGGDHQRLLSAKDLVRDLPLRGLLLGAAVLLLLLGVARSGLLQWLEALLPVLIPAKISPLVAAAALMLLTIFATELLNNTTVATVLFPLSLAIARRVGLDPVALMIGVSVASTCAFMTPIATPVNALALGGIRHVSLRTFFKNGLVANLIGALWIAAWVRFLIPPILGALKP